MVAAYELMIARTGIAIIVASMGALLALGRKSISHYQLCNLISLAAGALLAVTLLDITRETIEATGLVNASVGIASGYAAFYLIGKFVWHICPACAATHTEERFLSVSIMMIIAISIHSTMDGVSIATAQELGTSIGWVIFLAVSFHKFPEGLALAAVARGAGYGRSKALFTTVAIQLTTALGGFLSLALLSGISAEWLGLILAHAGGGFLYLVIHAMLGEMIRHEKASVASYASLGFAVVGGFSLALDALGIGG